MQLSWCICTLLTNSFFPFLGSGYQLTYLRECAARRRFCYLRPGTRSNILSQIKTYIAFCFYFKLQDVPASADTLCTYAEFLLRSLRSPASARSYLSAVSTLHVWLSQDIGVFSSAQLRQFWKGVDLTVRYFPNSKLPLTLPQLRILLSSSCTLGKFAVVFRALLPLTFFTMVRISSFLPLHPRQFDYTRHLALSDLRITDTGFSVRIEWAKNLQNSRDQFMLPVLPNQDSVICPVKNLSNYLPILYRTTPDSPLFVVPGDKLIPLSIPLARSWFRRVSDTTSLAGTDLLSHSVRRGSCTAAFSAGASLPELVFFGGWHSLSIFNYLSAPLA